MTTSRRTGRPPGRPRYDGLSPAEQRVLEGVRRGMTNPEIAEMLGISPDAVKYHVSNMLGKLELPDRHALAAWNGELRETRSRMWWWVFAFLGAAAALGVAAWWVSRTRESDEDFAANASVTATPATTATATASSVTHPQGGDEVVLRYWTTDGYPVQELSTDRLLLFGNGRLLHRRHWTAVGDGWQEIWLTEAGMQRFLEAVWQGGAVQSALRVPPGSMPCADCGEPNLEVHLSGEDFLCLKCIPEDRADYQRLTNLTTLLGRLDQRWFSADEMVSWGRYIPDALEVDFRNTQKAAEPDTAGLPSAVVPLLGAGIKTVCGQEAADVRAWLDAQPSSGLELDTAKYQLLARPLSPSDADWQDCGLSVDRSYVEATPPSVDIDALPDGPTDLLLAVRRAPPTEDPARGLRLNEALRLYGDGRIFLPAEDEEARVGYRVLHLTPEGVQRLSSRAAAAATGQAGEDSCVSCPGDHFVIALPDRTLRTRLDPEPRASTRDYGLPALQSFANLLYDVDALLGPGEVLSEAGFTSEAIVVQGSPRRGDDPRAVEPWPFADIPLESLTKPTLICGQAAQDVRAFLDGIPKKWRALGTGRAWLVRYRYAFPDEMSTCADEPVPVPEP